MINIVDANLRKMDETDLELVLSWRNDDNIRKWMINTAIIELKEHSDWFERNKNHATKKFLILEYQGQPQAYVSFVLVPNSKSYEWGFYLQPFAPKGMGLILGELALKYAFSELEVDRVFGQVLSFNEKSIGFHRKMGFKQEGVLRQHFKDDRGEFDIYQFGLLQTEWLESK